MIQAVLLDLDGTILDTNELIIQSLVHVFRTQGLKMYTREQMIMQMGKTLEAQMQHFSGREDVADLVAEYRKFNVAHHDEYIREFPYVTEVIQTLRQHQIRVGVVTTKMRKSSMRSLEHFGLDKWIETLVTVEDVRHPKSHPEPVMKALEELGVRADQALMVGDSSFDIIAANEAGAGSVAVSWSLKGEAYLQQYHPRYVIHDMRELLDIVGIVRDGI